MQSLFVSFVIFVAIHCSSFCLFLCSTNECKRLWPNSLTSLADQSPMCLRNALLFGSRLRRESTPRPVSAGKAVHTNTSKRKRPEKFAQRVGRIDGVAARQNQVAITVKEIKERRYVKMKTINAPFAELGVEHVVRKLIKHVARIDLRPQIAVVLCIVALMMMRK